MGSVKRKLPSTQVETAQPAAPLSNDLVPLHPMHKRLAAYYDSSSESSQSSFAPAARLAIIFYAGLASWGLIWLLGRLVASLF